MKKMTISTKERTEIIDISNQVKQAVSESKLKDGFCTVYIPHTTAAVTINEGADPAVAQDIVNKINDLIPKDPKYLHTEGNSDAHIKSAIIGSTISIPIEGSKLVLGTWQSIFFCEFDGPRLRTYYVKLTGEKHSKK